MIVVSQEEKMDPEKIMDELTKETLNSLKLMEKARTAEEKLIYSEIVLNLSKSLSFYLDTLSDDFDDDEDDDDDLMF